MKILIIANAWFPVRLDGISTNGVNTVINNQNNILKKIGHEVRVMGTSDSVGDLIRYNINSKIHSFSLGIRRQPLDMNPVVEQIEKTLEEYNPDLIITLFEYSKPLKYLADYHKDHGTPLIAFTHNVPTLELSIAKAYKYIVDSGGIMVAPTEYVKRKWDKVVPGCINYTEFFNVFEKSDYRDINTDRDRIITITRIDKTIRGDIVAAGFNKSNEYCEMYGFISSKEEPYFDKSIKPYLSDKVKYGGSIPRSDLMDTLCKSKLMVHPVIDDAAPNAVVESLSCGVPVVVLTGKEKDGSFELFDQLKIDGDTFSVNIFNKRINAASDLVSDKIHWFLSSEYNTQEYRNFISDSARKLFSEENFCIKFEKLIDISKK